MGSMPAGLTGVASQISVPAGQHRMRISIPGAPPFDGQLEAYGTGVPELSCRLTFHPAISNPVVQCDLPVGTNLMQLVVQSLIPASPLPVSFPVKVTFEPLPTEPVCNGYPFSGPPPLSAPAGWSGAEAAPVCGSTQDVCTQLQVVINKLNILDSMTQLIQRQAVPFAYLLGTPSVGLIGAGDIAAQGILGCSVTITAQPPGHGQTADNPKRAIPKLGAIQFKTVDGFTDERQLHYAQQLVLDAPPLSTALHYTLAPGVTATITPLLREF